MSSYHEICLALNNVRCMTVDVDYITAWRVTMVTHMYDSLRVFSQSRNEETNYHHINLTHISFSVVRRAVIHWKHKQVSKVNISNSTSSINMSQKQRVFQQM